MSMKNGVTSDPKWPTLVNAGLGGPEAILADQINGQMKKSAKRRPVFHPIKRFALLSAMALTLALTAPATSALAAGSPAQSNRGPVDQAIAANPRQDAGPTGLPFAGLDIALMLGGGIVLFGAGAALRQLAEGRTAPAEAQTASPRATAIASSEFQG
jgi:hypothetical protein